MGQPVGGAIVPHTTQNKKAREINVNVSSAEDHNIDALLGHAKKKHERTSGY